MDGLTTTDSAAARLRTPSIVYSATSTAGGDSTVLTGGLSPVDDGENEQETQDEQDTRSPVSKSRKTLRKMQSINRLTSGAGGEKRLEKARSRRMAQVNQEVKILDIARTTRGLEKKKVANKGEIFKFDCEGDISTYGGGGKRHVKWHATFDKPIEQLIYPSLQRFDNEGYEEKRKIFRQLHGGHETNVKATSPQPGPRSPKSGQQQQQQQQFSYTENHGIRMDLLPDSVIGSSDIMFLHTPKWTVEVMDMKPSPKGEQPLSFGENKNLSPSSPKSALKRQLSSNKPQNLTVNISSPSKSSRPNSRHISSPFHRKDMRMSRDDDSYNDSENYSISSDEYESEKELNARLSARKYRSVIDEIEQEGEKFLRQQIKEHYKVRVEEKVEQEQEEKDLESPFYELRKTLLVKNGKSKFPPIPNSNADSLYAQLVDRHKMNKSTNLFSPMNPMTPAARLNKLSEQTAEEIAYNDQSKIVKSLIPKESDYLADGVMYYRIQNQLHNSQLQELKAIEQRKMIVHHKKVSRRYSNHFSQRLSARKSEIQHSVSEMHLARNEDPHMVKATDIQFLEDVQELKYHRLNRAIQNKFHGFTSQNNLPLLEVMKKSNISVPTEADNEKLKLVTVPQPDTSNKNSFLSKFAMRNTNNALNKETEDVMLAERNKRKAQDLLLLNQLDSGVLPETFIKSSEDPRFVTINLSQYGIGDVRGLCLGKCLKALDRLQSLGLTDNRLTSVSLPTIIQNLHFATVMDLDLSFNVVHDQGAKALANHFRYTGNVLRYLDLCNCQLRSEDIKILCEVLKIYPNNLEELYLAGNIITDDGSQDLCAYLGSRTCVLLTLDLSWNRIGEAGAIEFAQAMHHNKSLLKLNIASNGINDKGGQRFADSLIYHETLEELNLAQNGISNGTCFVLAQAVKGHKSLRKIDLSLNPLGEAGARSIFRTILRGLSCFITMRNCSYPENKAIFNHTYPTSENPYVMDLTEPYKRAVVQELLIKYLKDPTHCRLENIFHRENPKSNEVAINLWIQNNQVCLKNTTEKWNVPRTGTLRFIFHQETFVPSLEHRIDEKAFNILQIIVENGITEIDKRTWLGLLCQDIYITTEQAQSMIDRFKKNRTIGTGGLNVLDILKSIWKYLIDTENMFDFLFANTDANERKDLIYAITLKQYKFNWSNPTSHWNLNLGDKVQHAIMMQLIAINNSESEFSRTQSGRGDTSQYGNWYNFRNAKYTNNRLTTEIMIDKEWITNLPNAGTIDFDYVSTARPPADLYNHHKKKKTKNKIPSSDLESEDEENLVTLAEGDDSEDLSDASPMKGSTGRPKSSARHATPTHSRPISSKNASTPTSSRTRPTSSIRRKVKLITDDEFYVFMQQLGLTNRSKVSGSATIFALMDLQLASAKYYFCVKDVLLILDAFQDHWDVQSRVIVALFSRIKDLHNLDLLLRNLDIRGQQEIIKRLGYLNVLNPLKISFDFVLSLKYLDNRIIVVSLMELAAIESADQISEEPNTELPIATLYGAYTRALNEVRPEVMRFSYADFGVRTNNVSWSSRKELVKKFLVGTQPIDEEMYQVVTMFKELEAAGALTRGPIDLQYANHQKSLKSVGTRSLKVTKSMTNAMRSAANAAKKAGV